MTKVIAIPMLATIAAVGAQTINIYSSTDCSGTPTTYDCGSVWDRSVCILHVVDRGFNC